MNRDFFAVLAHELRSPLGAILGYAELLEDGALGALDDRVTDAVVRIRSAAIHLAGLADGIDGLAGDGHPHADGFELESLRDMVYEAVAAARFDAESRGVTLRVEYDGAGAENSVRTRAADIRRALVLAIGAGARSSPGRTLTVLVDVDAPAVEIRGGDFRGLGPGEPVLPPLLLDGPVDGEASAFEDRGQSDNVAPAPPGAAPPASVAPALQPLTGARLRLGFAALAARRAGARLTASDRTAEGGVTLRFSW